MDWRRLVESGTLICPVTRRRLTFSQEAGGLVSEDGRYVYPVVDDRIPVLLADAVGSRTYHQEAAATAAERPAGASRVSLPGRLYRRFPKDYRTEASREAFREAMDGGGEDGLLLSIGGGPNRPDPRLVNLNVALLPNVDIVADAHALPYADDSVDAIFCEAVLEHLEDPPRAVGEMGRCLKPGKMVYAVTPFMQAYHGYPSHFQNFTLTGHVRLFERAGLKVMRSGTCVGPVHTLLILLGVCAREYLPGGGLWFKLWDLVSLFLHPLDKLVNRRGNAHVVASSTFVLAVK